MTENLLKATLKQNKQTNIEQNLNWFEKKKTMHMYFHILNIFIHFVLMSA